MVNVQMENKTKITRIMNDEQQRDREREKAEREEDTKKCHHFHDYYSSWVIIIV